MCKVDFLTEGYINKAIPSVQIPNRDSVPIHALGRVKLDQNLSLEQALGVPSFCFNLLLVSKLTRDLIVF